MSFIVILIDHAMMDSFMYLVILQVNYVQRLRNSLPRATINCPYKLNIERAQSKIIHSHNNSKITTPLDQQMFHTAQMNIQLLSLLD